MSAEADEAYAPENAKPQVKEAATAVIGHHDEDGIAAFLRQRFELYRTSSQQSAHFRRHSMGRWQTAQILVGLGR